MEIDSEYDEDEINEKDEEDGVEEAKGQSKQQFWEPGIAYDVDSWVNNATPDIQEEFLESALVNACILYKIIRELAFLEVEYTHLQFRVAIAMALAQEWEDMGCVFNPNTQPAAGSPGTLLKRGHALRLRLSSGSKRSSPNDSHFTYLERIPLMEGGKGKVRLLVCIFYSQCPKRDLPKKKRQVSRWCRKCAAPLCVPECFAKYHACN